MAKSSTKSKYTSKGERPNVNRNVLKNLARDVKLIDRMINIKDAWKDNKTDPWVTIDNPNTKETNKKFIRVRAKSLWGDPRKQKYSMNNSKDSADV